MIALNHLSHLARGIARAVYPHPDNPDWLIKVICRDRMDSRGLRIRAGKKTRWYKFPRRHGIYITFAREIDEYLAVKSRHPEPIPCLQELFGLIETDLGIGLIVEKLRGPDGGLAPSLGELIKRQGFTPGLRKDYQVYLDLLQRYNIITSSFAHNNLLWAVDARFGHRLVLIDGLGDKTLLGINKLSRFMNRRSNLSHWRKTCRRLEKLDRERAAVSQDEIAVSPQI